MKLRKLGFTFVETLLAIIIVGSIAGVAAKVLISGLDVYSLIVNRHDASQTARLAMERMVDEILLIDWTDITYMSDTRFSFIDNNGYASSFKKQNRSFAGKTVPCIFRGDDFLAGNVTSLDFDYLTETGANTIWSWQVRRINIEFTVTALANAGSIHLRTDVYPRRFMYDNFE